MSTETEPVAAVESPVIETTETAQTTEPTEATESTESPEAESPEAEAQEAVVPPNKLFVGNIFYKTKKSELEELFKDVGVQHIQIPLRKLSSGGRTFLRPRGYAFLTFKEGEDLDKVIEKYNEVEFKGRNIYVLYPNARVPGEEKKSEDESDDQESNGEESEVKKEEKKPKAKKEKVKKEKIPFDESKKSLDTLHLKNLHFSVKSQDLKDFFESNGETVVWASVPFTNLPKPVVKKLLVKGKSVERRNKGFAFVKLQLNEGETLQEKIDKFSGMEFKERAMIASAAYDTKPPVEEEDAPAEDETTPVEEESTPVAEENTPVAEENTPVEEEKSEQ